jgi:hypothetical protein
MLFVIGKTNTINVDANPNVGRPQNETPNIPRRIPPSMCEEAKKQVLARRKAREAQAKVKEDIRAALGAKVVYPRKFSEMEIAQRQMILDRQIDAMRQEERDYIRQRLELDPFNLGHWSSP